MSYINETDFVIENKELVYPEIVTDGLQLYYDAKGKRDTDYHRDTMLDMSGNKNHGKLHNFAYEKHSGYKDGLVFDYIDDKLVRPKLNLKPDDFTFMLNGNIVSFSPDGTVKRVQDGEVIESKGFNLVRNGDFNLTNHVEWAVNTNIEHIIKNNEVTIIGKGSPRSTGGNWFTLNTITQPYSDSIFYITALVKGQGQAYIGVSYNSSNLYLNDSFRRASYYGKFTTNNSARGYATLGGTTNDEITFKEVVAIDLTQTFGAGNEPTKEEMDEIIKRFGFIPNAQDLIDRVEYRGNDLGDMENIIDGLYKTEVLSGEEIYTDKADDAVVHVEVDGKSYQQIDSNNLFNPSSSYYTNGINSGLVSWELNLKPNTVYTASTNMPNNGATKNVFFHIKNSTASSSLNGLSDNKPFSLTTNSTGLVEITTRLLQYSGNIETIKNRDHWIKVEEGELATPFQGYPSPTPDYPVEINSLNDFDVVSSVGRENLLSDNVLTHFSRPYIKDGDIYRIDTLTDEKVSNYLVGIKINSSIFTIGKTYTLSFKTKKIKGNVYDISGHSNGFGNPQVFIDGKFISNTWSSKVVFPNDELVHEFVVTLNFNGGSGDNNLYIQPNRTSSYSSAYILDIWDLKVEEGLGTPYSSPLSESIQGSNTVDKINLLLDKPLRSVGDVKDRLFRDSDGVWKIERNVAQYISDGNDSWRLQSTKSNRWDMTSNSLPISSIYDTDNNATTPVLNSHFIGTRGVIKVIGTYIYGKNIRIYWAKPTSVDDLKSILKSYYDNGKPVTWYYQIRPYLEILPQPLQDKLNNLRSFEDSNYVYTVLPNEDNYLSDNLKPTLHAKFLYNNWYKEDRVINNLMIYNRALTNEEMLQNYKTIKRRWGM